MRLNIVNFLDADWAYDYKRPHLEGLGKYANLLCIEPPVTLDIPFRRPSLFLDWLKRRRILRQVGSSLWLYKPFTLVPYSLSLRLPGLKRANRVIMKISLNHVINRLGMKVLIVMIPHPAQDYIIGMLEETLLCYDVYDEHSENMVTSTKMRQLVDNAGVTILKKADIVFTSARNLMERKKSINPNTHFVPNAADVTFFLKTLEKLNKMIKVSKNTKEIFE